MAIATTSNGAAPAAAPIPKFDDETGAGRKLCIICSKSNMDMVYAPLIIANAALGEGIEVNLFFTFWGFDMITKKRMGDIKFAPVGNPGTHMPQMVGGLPGMTAMATSMMKKQLKGLEVPEVPEFLEQIVASGGRLWACKMTFDMMKLKKEDLYEPVEGPISAADFIEMAEGAQIIFV